MDQRPAVAVDPAGPDISATISGMAQAQHGTTIWAVGGVTDPATNSVQPLRDEKHS